MDTKSKPYRLWFDETVLAFVSFASIVVAKGSVSSDAGVVLKRR